jgi:glucose/arabinose dehydrogenase
MIFNEFFNTNECQPIYPGNTGGNLSDFKDNKILMTIGDYDSYERIKQKNNNPQNINSLIGKIISIDEKTKEYKILSMGHRNPQGLYYDKENNVIYSTEHGPQGGDEVNVNTSPDGEIKNYGWGTSSYGEHYGFPDADNSERYKIAPLNKSHAKYGFIEPLKYFNPSIAPAQIIKTEKFIKMPNKNIIYVGALGYTFENGRRSIHQFILDADLKIEQHNIMPVGERVRDMIYIEELNKIFMFLEYSGSIGVLEVDN